MIAPAQQAFATQNSLGLPFTKDITLSLWEKARVRGSCAYKEMANHVPPQYE